MSNPQDRFKARREQLLKSAPQPSKLDPANVPAKATMEFLASLRDDQPTRLRTPAAAGDGWDKIEARLAGRKSQQNASQQSPQQKPPERETLRTPLAAGDGWEQLLEHIHKENQERRSKASPPHASGQTPDDQH